MKFYKHLSTTFFIITLWCVYVFFDYYSDRSFMAGLTLYIDYLFSALFVLFLALISLFLSFSKFKASALSNFLYVFSAFTNIFLVAVYSLQLVFSNRVREFFSVWEPINGILLFQMFFGVYLFVYIYKNKIYNQPY
ncbi:hypothetical protein Q765_07790 [Flavobacterium rivuli WB 3.3-2 = DSM 21788]|uniref:Uncharacterized protein n=1 Tax=Flavobacterium rivuli WB 3.3-2 = DSM 21788 TaxID=1121895 RepID=A0A0A2M383_9FLAO|nr:hypothetical protein Q765_07790 [Flavobacterium rivuli WB 3.3-2 = DSM 21788]